MIFLNVGGNNDDNDHISHGLLGVEMALSVSVFVSLYLHHDVVHLHYSKGLVPRSKVNISFNFYTTSTAFVEGSNQFAYRRSRAPG
jgi:hypothetical protein